MRKIKVMISIIVLLGMVSVIYLPQAEGASGYAMQEIINFRVETDTQYIETSSLAVGDMNGNNLSDVAVTYDNYISDSNFKLAVYEINNTNYYIIGTLENFSIGTPGIMTVDPTNAYMYDINDDGKDELFIYGRYNGSSGVFVISYENHSLNIINSFGGTDSAILSVNNSTYLVVAGDGIYSIENGSFSYISGTSNIASGFVRTGNFSNEANIAILDSGTMYFYSFKNNTLTYLDSLSINIPVSGWGNDIGYLDGFSKVSLIAGYYDILFLVTYHNGYTVVLFENNTFQQNITGVLNGDDGNAMCSSAGKVFIGQESDDVIVGFGNYIYSPLFKVYEYNNGNLIEIYSKPAEDGNTRVITIGDIDGDGISDIILGSESDGYVRIFSSAPPVYEINNVPLMIILALFIVIFIRIKKFQK